MQTAHAQQLAVTPLQTFNNTLADRPVELTALLVDGEPWFRGTDVAAALGYSDQRQAVRNHVDDDDKEKLNNLWVAEMPPPSRIIRRELRSSFQKLVCIP